jgi:hypothetical protein
MAVPTNEFDTPGTVVRATERQAPTAPLGIGDFEGDTQMPEALVGADEGRRVSTSTLLIVGVVVLAVVALLGMRVVSRATAAGGERLTEFEKRIEGYLQVFANMGNGDGPRGRDGVVDVLEDMRSTRHVPWVNVQRDPFVLFEASKTKETATGPSGPSENEVRRKELLGRIEGALKKVEVKSVMIGRGENSLANLNGKVLRVNEIVRIDGEAIEFVIKAIQAEGVTVVARNDELEVYVERVIAVHPDQ